MKTLFTSAAQIFRSFVSNPTNTPIAYQEIKQQSKFSKRKFNKQDLLIASLRCFMFTLLITSCIVAQTENVSAKEITKPITANILSAVMNLSDFFSIIAVLLIAAIAFYLSFKPSVNKSNPKKSF